MQIWIHRRQTKRYRLSFPYFVGYSLENYALCLRLKLRCSCYHSQDIILYLNGCESEQGDMSLIFSQSATFSLVCSLKDEGERRGGVKQCNFKSGRDVVFFLSYIEIKTKNSWSTPTKIPFPHYKEYISIRVQLSYSSLKSVFLSKDVI